MPAEALHICAYDVPLAHDGSTRMVGFEPEQAAARNFQYLAASRNFTVGPMPIQLFLDTFLPMQSTSDRARLLSDTYAFRSVPAHAETAAEVYVPLISALNRHTTRKSRCPGFVFDDTAARSKHPRRLGYMKPHICCYSTSNSQMVRSADKESRSELGYAELFFEVKADPMYDFYADPPRDASVEARAAHSFATQFEYVDGISSAAHEANRALGQHVAYATEIFARQFRVFLFSVSMSGSRARLLRWDRSGCVVSESFDIREQPKFLCEFLWRFSQVSHAGRGHDVTIEPALLDEEVAFHTLVREQTGFQLGVQDAELDEAVLRHYASGKVWAVHVLTQDAVGEEPRALRYIISRPVVSPVSLEGHGTRGYWAVELSTRRVVFLKDTWRHRTPTLEGDTLRTLAAADVRNIPSVAAHADVPHRLPPYERELTREDFQTTRTDEFPSQPWVCRGGSDALHIRRRKHYRLVLATVGYDLRSMQSSSELLHAGYDVFTAMRDALAKDSRIHRDISVGNVLLVREGDQAAVRKGYLIDWESSCKADEEGVACNEDRVGTWLFMSIKTLARRHIGKHTFQDDTESLLYVILYSSLLWLSHNLSKEELTNVMFELFERSTNYGSRKAGGDGKAINATMREYTDAIVFKNGAIQRWLNAFMSFHTPRPGEEAFKGKWNDPDHLDGFWSDFLKTESLDVDDRVDNDRRVPAYPPPVDSSASSGSTTSISSDSAGGSVDAEPPLEAPPTVLSGRRTRSGDRNPSVTSHPAKRVRAAPAPEDPSEPTESPPLRRSTRPRKQPDRGMPVTLTKRAEKLALREVDAPQASRSAQSAPTSRRGRGPGASRGTSSTRN